MTYRKIGGLHWLFIGRLRIAFCICKPKPIPPIFHKGSKIHKGIIVREVTELPKGKTLDEILEMLV